MTTPEERTRAVLEAETFLKSLLAAEEDALNGDALRDKARYLLRHYPTAADLNQVAAGWGTPFASVINCPFATSNIESSKVSKKS